MSHENPRLADKAVAVQGPTLTPDGVHHRIWAKHHRAELIIYGKDGTILRSLPMESAGDEFFAVTDREGRAGDLYKYRFGGESAFPDPASRYQPFGVHGPSMVVENGFRWSDHNWRRASLHELVIYELHVGTFTPGGTFKAAIEKLAYLANLGVNAIEIMPIGDFPGSRNWGYDGVSIYAPARVYGTPEELRELIDAAHGHGLTTILDVVYNHFGPDGNYLSAYHPDYFNPTRQTPWGSSFNFELPQVRSFFLQNIGYWMDEFHIDGFRLDATHAIVDTSEVHILSEIAATAHQRGGFVIAEDDRNDPRLVTDVERGGVGLDGCWADDFHHVVNVALTGNGDAYFKNYKGTADELEITLKRGWLFSGQVQPTSGQPRGGDPSSLRPEQLVYCISNHDQAGNRAFGERLSQLVDPAAYRAASALLLFSPYTPMVFMGQEWAASTPFQYFTDHNEDLGKKIIVGRRREFRDFAAFRDATVRETIPSPQAEETFRHSKLNWDETNQKQSQGLLELYRACLKLRFSLGPLQDRSRANWQVIRQGDIVSIVYGTEQDDRCMVIADLTGTGIQLDRFTELRGKPERLEVLFDSNAAEFACGDPAGANAPRTILALSV
jgi:maltooligosyltrehalose trehalohydrolase